MYYGALQHNRECFLWEGLPWLSAKCCLSLVHCIVCCVDLCCYANIMQFHIIMYVFVICGLFLSISSCTICCRMALLLMRTSQIQLRWLWRLMVTFTGVSQTHASSASCQEARSSPWQAFQGAAATLMALLCKLSSQLAWLVLLSMDGICSSQVGIAPNQLIHVVLWN